MLFYLFLLTTAAAAAAEVNQALAGAQIWRLSRCREIGCAARLSSFLSSVDVLGMSDGYVDVFVPRADLNTTRHLVHSYGLPYQVAEHDAYRAAEEAAASEAPTTHKQEYCTYHYCPRPLLDSYMTFQQVEWFLKKVAATYPEHVTLSSQGTTEEGRDLWLVTVSRSDNRGGYHWSNGSQQAVPADGKAKRIRAVFVEAGAHAREWISPATVLNILMAQVDVCVTGGNCKFVYYFMPLINPDGYEYSRTVDRYWRKNRSNPPNGYSCYGTDLNRNFAFHWAEVGSSSHPCSPVYHGKGPFSTQEISAERDALAAVIGNLDVHISYHSYGELILYPWGYASNISPAPNTRKMVRAARAYRRAVRKTSLKNYKILNAAKFYPVGGASDDYAKSLGVKYVYTIELRPTKYNGFVLPPSRIRSVFNENWNGFKAMLKFVWRR